MIFSCAMMAGVAALACDLTSDMHPYMVVFFRLATAQLCMLPWLLKNGIGVLKKERMALYVARAAFTLCGMLTWFYAVSIIPITDVVAISFVTPIFATVGAALILRETVRIRRWSATIVGFLGAMIILRRGVIEMTLAHWAALVAAGCAAVTLLIVKSLSRTEDLTKVVFYVGLHLLPISGVLAWTVWERPPSHLWLGIARLARWRRWRMSPWSRPCLWLTHRLSCPSILPVCHSPPFLAGWPSARSRTLGRGLVQG